MSSGKRKTKALVLEINKAQKNQSIIIRRTSLMVKVQMKIMHLFRQNINLTKNKSNFEFETKQITKLNKTSIKLKCYTDTSSM